MKNSNNSAWFAFVPNLLTICNLCCGTVGIYFAFGYQIQMALLFMFAGAIFDFLDGFVARLLKVSGELGKQLDSLSDLVSFGLLPGVMVFSIQRQLLFSAVGSFDNFLFYHWLFLLIPILIPALSSLRLAKFNIDTRQTKSFIGFPTPANALFFASVSWTIVHGGDQLSAWLGQPFLIALLVVVFSLLLVSEIPLFALKFTSFKFSDNRFRFIFLGCSVVLLALLRIPGITAVIGLYIVLSLVDNRLKGKSSKDL
jgi:CDP-diacylglycerol--serine O-phosphatidyltransferase